MPATDTAASWLQAFHSGADLPGGLAFRAALEQAGLDYTPDSLTRVDRLLRQIRRERAPEQRAFMADAAQRNFVVLLGFYFGTLIARYTLQRVDWYHHDELDQVLAADEVLKLPHGLSTSLVCTFRRDGELTAWFLPLKPLVNILFRSADTPDLLAAGDALMQRVLAAPLLQVPGADAPAAAAADYAAAALQRIGALAGAELANAVRAWLAEGRPADPQLLYENSAGRRRAARSWARVDADPVDTCRARLAYPEPDCVGAALSYCGHINLPEFRSAAIVIEAQWFAPHLHATIAVPCRPAGDAQAYALHLPRLLQPALREHQLALLARAFFAGMDSVKPAGLWAAHFVDENAADLLARRRAEQAAAALGASSGAFAAPDLAAIDMAREVAALPPEAADYLSVSTPSWGHTPALQPIFTAMPALLAGGRVVWGQLVQANRLMFSHAADGQLGDVVYDPAGRLGPAALQEAARKLFALRRAAGTSLPPQALAIASHLQNDLTRADGLPVPRSIAQSGLLLSSVWFERKHLPTGRLSERFFPLLIRDDAPGRVMLLPARWWPPALSAHWIEAEHAARRAEWEEARAALAGPRNEAQSLALGARLEAIEQYVARGIDEIRVADLCALGQPGFRADCEPPPREWEWEVDADLQALAETYLTDCERARARGEALPAERARLAYACAHTAQMVAMHRLLLRAPRGHAEPDFALAPDAILYVALGLVAGCESAALRMARLLCTLWEKPGAYRTAAGVQARAVFMLLARHVHVAIPALPALEPAPALEALLDEERWNSPDPAALAPLFEAACREHAEIAPRGAFQCLPIALLLMQKLRAMHGLASPRLSHPLLAAPLGSWPAAVELEAARDPLLRSLCARMEANGYNETAIVRAVLEGAPLSAPGAALASGAPAASVASPEQQAKLAHAELLLSQLAAQSETRRNSALRGRRMLIIGACIVWGGLLLWIFFQLRG